MVEATYLGNTNLKKAKVSQEWTKEELLGYSKCMEDPLYFIQNYVKIISLDEGLVPFKMYPFQEHIVRTIHDNRFTICKLPRQSGKSTTTVSYLLHYALFNPNSNIAILANKSSTARDILSRVQLAYENLPKWMQQGVINWNKGNIELENKSVIVAAATSSSAIRGGSYNIIFLDEFAFVENATEFYTSTYPVVSAGRDTKVIITSTANGLGNVFHKIWEGAIQETNEFIPFRVDWWDVPGRDEEWKKATVANTSPVQFDQEFGNTFFGTGDTLINANTLLELRRHDPLEITKDDVKVYNQPIKDHNYVMLVDVAKGRGQDYSTFSVIDISAEPFKQVAVYRNNLISPLLFPNIIYKYANSYNQAMVVIESNDAGMVVCNGLYHDLEYENVHVESSVKANAIGIEITRKTKRLG